MYTSQFFQDPNLPGNGQCRFEYAGSHTSTAGGGFQSHNARAGEEIQHTGGLIVEPGRWPERHSPQLFPRQNMRKPHPKEGWSNGNIAMPRYIPRLLAILPLLFFKAKYYTTFKILIVAHVYNEHWWAGVGWVYVNLIGLVWKCCNPNGFWLDMLAAKSIVFFPLEWPLGSIHSIPHFWKTLFSGATSAKSLSRNTSQAPSMLKSASRTCEAKVWTEVYRESWDPGWT